MPPYEVRFLRGNRGVEAPPPTKFVRTSRVRTLSTVGADFNIRPHLTKTNIRRG